MKNCIYEPVFDLFLLFNFQIDSALTISSRLNTDYSIIKKGCPIFRRQPLFYIVFY